MAITTERRCNLQIFAWPNYSFFVRLRWYPSVCHWGQALSFETTIQPHDQVFYIIVYVQFPFIYAFADRVASSRQFWICCLLPTSLKMCSPPDSNRYITVDSSICLFSPWHPRVANCTWETLSTVTTQKHTTEHVCSGSVVVTAYDS